MLPCCADYRKCILPPNVENLLRFERLSSQSQPRSVQDKTPLMANSAIPLKTIALSELSRRAVLDSTQPAKSPYKFPCRFNVPEKQAFLISRATDSFFQLCMDHYSVDGKGWPFVSVVNASCANAFWDPVYQGVIYGRAIGSVSFTGDIDIGIHEFFHGIMDHMASVDYCGQSGSLCVSFADIFGAMGRQFVQKLNGKEKGHWDIGKQFMEKLSFLLTGCVVQGVALRSLAAPGTAYRDLPHLGSDGQPWRMSGYVETEEDHGGVHINSGIPSYAFYLAYQYLSRFVEERPWDTMGKVWYQAIQKIQKSNLTFADFAQLTIEVAIERYPNDSGVEISVEKAWQKVEVLRGPHVIAGKQRMSIN